MGIGVNQFAIWVPSSWSGCSMRDTLQRHVKCWYLSHELLSKCFPNVSLIVPSLLVANHGIASSSAWERAHYFFAMCWIMVRWRQVNPRGLIIKIHKMKWSIKELDELEKEVAAFYTQSFYNCFRWAAVLPHRLSESAAQACPLVGHKHIPSSCISSTTIINTQTYSLSTWNM